MTEKLIALENYTGVITVGIGCVVWRLLANSMLEVSVEESTHAFGKSYLSRVLLVVIENDIHSVHLL